MRIADTSTGQGVLVEREEGDSQELVVIAQRIMPEWLELFARKNRDYGSGSAYELGVRGQYSDIHRKMIKLKRAMWDGEQLDFEDTDEIIKDLISHLFLTLHMFGLQREAEQAYVYTEDDAAVDAFFRMVGGDAENALKMSGVLTEPFRTLVRDRATTMLGEQQAEAEYAASMSDGEDRKPSMHDWAAKQQAEMAERLKRGTDERIAWGLSDGKLVGEARNGAREARRRAREADGSPGEATLRAMAENGAYGFRADGGDFASEEFAQADFEQNHYPYGAELKVGPPRIITEQVDGRTRYYHEPYPGADREPLALVPKALIERAQKDQHVLSKEQEAGLRTLADWANNQ
ncbi:hypothetical protein SEA_SHAKENBAKE_53 [Streptomyces phage ShakeNBake]|nr:hypothetical protein SEA_SHAKENBAKE_53 [Streptomyces phage ShakeNBake]